MCEYFLLNEFTFGFYQRNAKREAEFGFYQIKETNSLCSHPGRYCFVNVSPVVGSK